MRIINGFSKQTINAHNQSFFEINRKYPTHAYKLYQIVNLLIVILLLNNITVIFVLIINFIITFRYIHIATWKLNRQGVIFLF